MKKIILWVFVSLIVICSGYIVNSSLNHPNINILERGTFIILSLTLITLIFYTYYTNVLATVSQYRWSRESVLNSTYEMDVRGNRTLFRMTNPSTLIIKAKVWCAIKVYGSPVNIIDGFNGKRTWVLFPHQTSQGWFDIDPLLAQKGKTPKQMVDEHKPDNRMTQFTMDLTIEFRDEEDVRRRLPTREHFFDFGEHRWIPVLTESGGW
ncbi:hypothetical protein ACFLSX_03095 [Calditrichota bacterium]